MSGGRECLDVVDHGRVGLGTRRHRTISGLPPDSEISREETELVRRQQARQRVASLDHFEQRLLLAVEVVVGTLDDVDAELLQQTRRGQIDGGALQCLDLANVRALGRQVHRAGADRERSDGRTFDDAIRIESHQRAVLERGRLTLGTVGDNEPRARATVAYGRPLSTGREAGATATSKTRGSDLVNRREVADL